MLEEGPGEAVPSHTLEMLKPQQLEALGILTRVALSCAGV